MAVPVPPPKGSPTTATAPFDDRATDVPNAPAPAGGASCTPEDHDPPLKVYTVARLVEGSPTRTVVPLEDVASAEPKAWEPAGGVRSDCWIHGSTRTGYTARWSLKMMRTLVPETPRRAGRTLPVASVTLSDE